MSEAPSRSVAFLSGGGRAAEMIRERDWSSHSLGPPERWPDALRVALGLVLNSPESMILCWGPELHFFFNDTYFPLLGPRLSWAMGARFDEVWADGLEQAKPIIDDAMAGRSEAPKAEVGKTVLIVDDEATIRMLVCDVLGDLGYATVEAEDGPSGLKVLRSDVRVDLLVTDVGLPGGMNGRQVADAARELRPGLKVLFITGYAENAAVSNGHLAPGMAVLTKPFAMDDLGARIPALIEG